MGRQDDGGSFSEVINAAQQLPNDPGEGANAGVPQLFQFPIPTNERIIEDEPVPDAKRIGGMPKYKLRAHFNRFVIGPVISEDRDGVIAEDRDDSASYEELQNQCLEGRAILCWEKVNFLRDGGVVIACKWMVKHDPDDYRKKYGQTNTEDEG